jgi:hypothetical protein
VKHAFINRETWDTFLNEDIKNSALIVGQRLSHCHNLNPYSDLNILLDMKFGPTFFPLNGLSWEVKLRNLGVIKKGFRLS